MQEAMNQVKKDLGSDAVILQTKTVSGGLFGLFPRKRVEITAASDIAMTQPSVEGVSSNVRANRLWRIMWWETTTPRRKRPRA
jgi:flagellar biosynthesis protein FlhF